MILSISNILKNTSLYFLSIVFLGWVILWDASPGTITPILDENRSRLPQSIVEHKILSINGKEQHLTLRGKDSTKQVILFLHGGPGNSINVGLRNPDLILEKEFIVVQWDQYGAGRSYNTAITKEDMKIDSLLGYALEVTKYLCKRFNQEKIHIIGHSWGTHLGMLLVNEHPEWFYSFTGMAQETDVYEAEKIAFQWVKKQAILRNDQKGLKELSKISIPDTIIDLSEWNDQFGWTHRSYLNEYGGVLFGKEEHLIGGLLFPLLSTPEYNIRQKINYIRGLLFSLESTWKERLERSLHKEIDTLHVPVVIVHGLHDYNMPHTQVKHYFDQLKAPYKKFYTFEKSAHSPYMEEVNKFNAVIAEEILNKY